MLAAAAEAFCATGYFAASVEDIASSAGISRMTFYRHFSGKSALARELFRLNVEASMPRILEITRYARLDRSIIKTWIGTLFEEDRKSGQLLRVFIQANAQEPDFTADAHGFLGNLIVELGKYLPAFAIDPVADRKAWLEAWLIIYEILDQSNHAARGAGIADDPLVLEILADRFLSFVEGGNVAQKTYPVLIYDNDADTDA